MRDDAGEKIALPRSELNRAVDDEDDEKLVKY